MPEDRLKIDGEQEVVEEPNTTAPEVTEPAMEDMEISELDKIIQGGADEPKPDADEPAEPDAQKDKPEGKTSEKPKEPDPETLQKQVADKEKYIQERNAQIGEKNKRIADLERYEKLYNSWVENPKVALEQFQKLVPKESDPPITQQEQRDIADRILAGGEEAEKAILEVFDKAEKTRMAAQTSEQIKQEKAAKEMRERRERFLIEYPTIESEEGVEIVKAILREKGTADADIKNIVDNFYKLDDRFTGPIVVEAKYRAKEQATKKEVEQLKSKYTQSIDKTARMARTAGGVNATSGHVAMGNSELTADELTDMTPSQLDDLIKKRQKK